MTLFNDSNQIDIFLQKSKKPRLETMYLVFMVAIKSIKFAQCVTYAEHCAKE